MLAGLGIGGLAFALAAKDMLSNLFGGIVILIDKPFAIGDWIKAGDIEGTVEDINFRSVKVRTFEQAIVTLPNAGLVDNPIINFSRMGKRRVTFTLGLRLDTKAESTRSATEKMRQMLLKNEDIDPETIVVVLDSISEKSLNLLVYYFTKFTDWVSHLAVKQGVYFDILEVLTTEKIDMAPPIQVIGDNLS